MKGYYLMEFYHLQVGINPSHQALTSVGAPEWPSMSWSTNDIPIDDLNGATPPHVTPDG